MPEGEQFLGIDGLVDGDEVGAEVGDFLNVFEADDGEAGGGEAMLARMTVKLARPCWQAFCEERALPVSEVGPVDLAALARLAASCFSEMGFFGDWGLFSDEDIGISFRTHT